MPFLTKFGSHYGITPYRTGNLFFVAPAASYTLTGPQGQRSYSASDDHDGLSPERALRTIAQAITLSVASSGDVILLLRGTHTVTATITPRAGTALVGEQPAFGTVMDGMKYPTSLTIRGTDDELLSIEGSNIEIGYVNLQGSRTRCIVSFQTANAIDSFYLHDYYLELSGLVFRGTRGIDFAMRESSQANHGATTSAVVATAYLRNGMHVSNGANGEALLLASCNVKAVNLRFHNTAGTWATPVLVATDTDNTLLDNCIWSSSGTMTLAAAGYAFGSDAVIADGVHIRNCSVTANIATAASAFIGFTAGGVAGANLSENYAMGGPTTSANGGVLITRA